jgi:hypothetical protein
MPLSWNNINNHVAGDVLPLADWNQAATALNSFVGTWVTTGTINSVNTNGTPPFYAYVASVNVTTTSGGANITIPNGGFPNGVIAAFVSGVDYATILWEIVSAGSSKTTVEVFGTICNTGSAASNATYHVNVLIIGY